jgi:ammonia channel protein AmtB
MIGACAIIIWGAATSSAMFGTLKLIGKLRVSEVEERKGKIISQPNPIYKF